jgi:hypothetical protein
MAQRSEAQFANKIETDTAVLNIYKQLMVYLQEKIYVQTDKPYYKAGETVFYRLFLLDACYHVPYSMSRYVYVELIDQNNSVEVRQKIRPEAEGAYYNSFKLSQKLAQGYYKIRAYTRFMENAGIETFYSKPVFVIAENKYHLKMEINVAKIKEDMKHTALELRFVNTGSNEPAEVEDIFFQLNGKKQKPVKKRDDGVFEFKLPITDENRDRNLYVEAMDKQDSIIFKQFDVAPFAGDSVEISFFPEGGYIVDGRWNTIAFKALHNDGSAARIMGSVMDEDGDVVAKLSTKHDGMGIFRMIPDKEKKYFVEYKTETAQMKNKTEKTAQTTLAETAQTLHATSLQLSDFKSSPFALQSAWKNEKLFISINKNDLTLPSMSAYSLSRGHALL